MKQLYWWAAGGRPGSRWARAWLGVVVVVLAGCAEQQIRDRSQQALGAGDYERAIAELEGGVKQYPESPLLRGGLIQARSEALTRLLANAASLRAAGKLDEAQRVLERGKVLDPNNGRLDALIADLATERRQTEALAEAEQWVTKKRPDAALKVIERALKDNRRHPGLLALQRRVEVELRQRQAQAAQAQLAETRPISLDFRDASLRAVLDAVSRNSGINFILDRDVRAETRITVFIRQARVEDALDLVVSTNQLAKKVIDPQTILVYPSTPDKQREYQEQVVRVFYLASAEAKNAAAFLRSMLKIREPFVDERTNMLALRDSHENIQLAERLISLYDSGEPEVLLEVEVLEINATRLTELGIKLPDTFSLTPLPPPGSAGLTLGNIDSINSDRIGLGVGGLSVNFRRQIGDFTTLANPRIRARNKEKAKILIGDKIPVITTTTGSTGFVSDSVNYIDVGLKLDVEPTVYADDEVAIKISLEVSTLGAAVRTNSGTQAFQIGTRNASTLLRLHDGETQLLAGLISKDDRTSSSRVPGVGDLPILGRLFSNQLDNGQRTELVLAITPRILRNIRRPDANETELLVGTDAAPRLRSPGALMTAAQSEPQTAVSSGGGAAAAGSATAVLAAATPSGSPSSQLTALGQPPAAPVRFEWSGPSEVKVGDTLELKLSIDAALPVRGVPLNVVYDKTKLQWVSAAEGDFLRRDGQATSFSEAADPNGGRVRVGLMRNQATGASGKATLLSVRFKALAAGTAEVRLDSPQPIGATATLPPITPPAPWPLQVR
jgi:general secretion pathway protein D